MISVQNLRQRLSGNNRSFILLFLALLFSCKSAQLVSQSPHKKFVKQQDNHAVVKDSNKIIDLVKTRIDTLDILYPDVIKAQYKIALVLPFQLDRIHDEDYNPPALTKKSQDFYSGFLLALRQFDPGNHQFELFILDNKSNPGFTSSGITTQLTEISPDLVICPTGRKTIEILASWSLLQKVPFLTFSQTSDTLLRANPWMMNTLPSEKRIFTNILHYFADSARQKNLIIIESSRQQALETEQEAAMVIDTSVFSDFKTCYVNIDNWKEPPYISKMNKSNNVLFYHLNDEVIINTIFPKLISSEKEYEVYLPYKWMQYRSLDIKLLFDSPVHFYSAPLINYEDSTQTNFIKMFREEFRTEPKYMAFMAYEIMPFILHQMSESGKYFMKRSLIRNKASIEGVLEFNHLPDYGGFENGLLEFYRFDNYQIKKEYIFQH